jgi:hypothetical protein
MQQSCEFKGMSHFCCFIALLPVVPFIATPFFGQKKAVILPKNMVALKTFFFQ